MIKIFEAMASVWYCVIVLIYLQQAYARHCSVLDEIRNCDECIRCGGTWCLVNDEIRCSLGSDDWCPGNQYQIPQPNKLTSMDGHMLHPQFTERFTYVRNSDLVDITYQHNTTTPKVKIEFLNSSFQGASLDNFIASEASTCGHEKCTTRISAMPTSDFCPDAGSDQEFISLGIHVDGISEVGTAKYHVHCACSCTSAVEKYSEKCNKRGDYSCGVCSCHDGWKGESCETETAPVHPQDCDRGDISGCVHPITGLVCSNNGQCLCGGKCKCFTDKEGSQYFDDHCADICTTSSYCDSCLQHPTLGLCKDCHIPMYIEACNKTVLDDKDADDKKIWIQCTEKSDDHEIHYAAMRDRDGETHIMVLDTCLGVFAPVNADVTVPAILGVLAIVACAMAVAGFMVWKNRAPPLPLTDPEYQNIDAEDCTGENPLYKPPTSSFKNPTYGKW